MQYRPRVSARPIKALKERQLFLPVGTPIPEPVRTICRANVDLSKITAPWDELVRLTTAVHTGHASAVGVLNRFGSAARGDALYEVACTSAG